MGRPCQPKCKTNVYSWLQGFILIALQLRRGDAGCGSRHPFGFAAETGSNREDQSHEVCAEWDGDCRPGYCCASLGAIRSANDALAQRAISDISADGIDGVAYAEPPGKGAPSSSGNATRQLSRQRQHGEPTQRRGTRKERGRRDGGATRRNGRPASAGLWRPKNCALRPAEPDLRNSRSGTTICIIPQPINPVKFLDGQEGRRLQASLFLLTAPRSAVASRFLPKLGHVADATLLAIPSSSRATPA
jgi:hypothetical protein